MDEENSKEEGLKDEVKKEIKEEVKTFTQAELDDIVKTRLSRATKDIPSKEELASYKAYLETQKTDQQKAIDAQIAVEATLQKANDRLILSEIKSLDGYDVKLLARLLDKSKITIDDNNNISGLKEAVTALETEFPSIKIAVKAGGANPPLAGSLTERDQLIEQYNEAEKQRNFPLMNQLMEQIKKKK